MRHIKPGDEFYAFVCPECGLPIPFAPVRPGEKIDFSGLGRMLMTCANGHQHWYPPGAAVRLRAEEL